MVALIVFGILVPVVTAVLTCWLVCRHLPPAVVKAIREVLHDHNEGTRQ